MSKAIIHKAHAVFGTKDLHELSQWTNIMMESGWQPDGFVTTTDNVFVQTMTKPAKKKPASRRKQATEQL